MLCTMWATLEVVYRPRFCAPNPTTAGAVAEEHMARGRTMGNRSMDPIATQATIPQKEIQKTTSQPGKQRQRSRQTAGGKAKLWTTVVTSLAFIGSPMAHGHHSLNSYGFSDCLSITADACRLQRGQGQGQTAQVPCSSTEAQKGRLARRTTIPRGRSDSSKRAGRNKTSSLTRVTAREGQKGPPGGPILQVADAHRLAEFFGTVCRSMVQVYRPIHATGTTAPGTPQASARESGSRKRKPQCLSISSRPLRQRRCIHAKRSRGHRSQGFRKLGRAKDCGELPRVGHKSKAAAQSGRSSSPTRRRAGPAPKEATNVSARTCSTGSRRRVPAPFWQARVNTTTNSIAPGQAPKKAFGEGIDSAHDLGPQKHQFSKVPACCHFNPAKKWQHTILQEPDFMDEWSAMAQAFHLAFEVNFDTQFDHAPRSRASEFCRQSAKSPRQNIRCKQLRFHSTIQLYIGAAESPVLIEHSVHENFLSMPGKPWSMSLPVRSSITECRILGKHLVSQCEDPDNQCAFMPMDCNRFHGKVLDCREIISDHDKKHGTTKATFDFSAECLHCAPQVVPVVSTRPGSSFPDVIQCRLDHESPLAEIPHDQLPVDEEEDEATPPNHTPGPAFIQRLIERFSRAGMNVHDRDFEVAVRTWYIDHVNMRRCTASRILQLVGPPQGWEQQFSVVHPDPPRPQRHSFVQCDLIITQSLHIDRFEGLITVLPAAHEAVEMYAVAYSFSDFISGYDITNAADADRLCRYHPCTITFGWDEIPHSLRQQHVMRHGDGFQVLVRTTAQQIPVSDPPQSGAASSSHELPSDMTHTSSGQSSSNVEFPWWDDPVHGRFTTPLHLFQLEAHDVTVELVNAQLALPSHAISAATNVPLECLEAIHLLRDRPIDFPEMAIPAILQRTGDIPIGSTDRLILIDIIYHHHSSQAGPPNRPTVVRLVHRVDFRVLRPQLLMYAAVYHYCETIQDTCEVILDRIPWPPADLEPRSVQHGSYARITVPPPRGYDVNTLHAAQALHVDGETDAFMDFLQEDSPQDEAASLQQVSARRQHWKHDQESIQNFVTVLPQDACVMERPSMATIPCNDEASESDANSTLQPEVTPANPAAMHHVNSEHANPQPLSQVVRPSSVAKTPNTLFRYFARADDSCKGPSCPPLRQNKCSESQQQDPPSFATNARLPAEQPQQQRPRPIWRMELDILFDEHARTHFQEIGPTMAVSVWYIHHVRHPSCLAPRIVELDDVRDLWYADLCNAWWDRIVRQQPLKVLIVS